MAYGWKITLSVPSYFVHEWFRSNKYAKHDYCSMFDMLYKDFNRLSSDTLSAWIPEDTRTNGFCHRCLKWIISYIFDLLYAEWYWPVRERFATPGQEELQEDFNEWLQEYHSRRSHQSYHDMGNHHFEIQTLNALDVVYRGEQRDCGVGNRRTDDYPFKSSMLCKNIWLRTSVNYFYIASLTLKHVRWESIAKITRISLWATANKAFWGGSPSFFLLRK